MGLLDQVRCPTGPQGRIAASMMNWGHGALTTWGLTFATIQPNFTILDLGCGGGKTINRLAPQVPQGKVFGLDHSADMVAYAKEAGMRDKIARNGQLYLKNEADSIVLPVHEDKVIVGVYIKADSWINANQEAQLKVNLQGPTADQFLP